MQQKKLLLLLTAILFSPCSQADDADLRARIDHLEAEIQALKAELNQVNSQAGSDRQPTGGDQQECERVCSLDDSTTAGGALTATTIYGYGEINYNHPRDSSQTQADLRRAVFGFGHRFDDETRFNSEFEFEHADCLSGRPGRGRGRAVLYRPSFAQNVNLKAGLFLMPFGLLNESHEPTHYYGVERNFVETAIIPSTWREGGLGIYGSTDSGLAWDAGVTTGFDVSKWDATSSEGSESPLGSVHQELQLAKAKDLAVYGALNWRGTPGLVVGASLFTGKSGQGTPGSMVEHSRVTLWDAHARWAPGRWDLSARVCQRHDLRYGKFQFDKRISAHAHSQGVLRLVWTGRISHLGEGGSVPYALRALRAL